MGEKLNNGVAPLMVGVQNEMTTAGHVAADIPTVTAPATGWYSTCTCNSPTTDVALMRMLLKLTKKGEYLVAEAAKSALIRMCNAVEPVK